MPYDLGMAKKDRGTIELDPMEWRDAMKQVPPPEPRPAPRAKPGKKTAPRAKRR